MEAGKTQWHLSQTMDLQGNLAVKVSFNQVSDTKSNIKFNLPLQTNIFCCQIKHTIGIAILE